MSPKILYSALGAIIFSVSFYAGLRGDASLNLCYFGLTAGAALFACAFANFENPNRRHTGLQELEYLQGKIHQAETILRQYEVTPALAKMANHTITVHKRLVCNMELGSDLSPLTMLDIYRLPEDIDRLVANCPYKAE